MGITHKRMHVCTGHMYPSNGHINPSFICDWGNRLYITLLMGITHKPMYHMDWNNRLYITLLMGITHKPIFHMDWTTDCTLPF